MHHVQPSMHVTHGHDGGCVPIPDRQKVEQ